MNDVEAGCFDSAEAQQGRTRVPQVDGPLSRVEVRPGGGCNS